MKTKISEVSNFSELLGSIFKYCFCSKNINNAINPCIIVIVLLPSSEVFYKDESMKTRKIAHKRKKS
jgi:hypothetical protein